MLTRNSIGKLHKLCFSPFSILCFNMLVIFCGEDTATSRTKCIEYRDKMKADGFDVRELQDGDVTQLPHLVGSLGLFYDKKIVFAENILKDKKSREYLKEYQDEPVEILIHESNLSERELKFVFPKAKYNSYKFSSSVFTLLDSLTPGKLDTAVNQLQSVMSQDNELLIFYMIKGRLKELILVKSNSLENTKLATWQIGKLKSQAALWDNGKLIRCYDNLYKIEKNAKTSSSVFTVTQALEMLLCFYL